MIKNYESKKRELILNQDLKCASCGEDFLNGQKIDLAHKIKASKFNYKEYGEEVIDHVLNLAATHSNGYKGRSCNDKQNLSRAIHPIEADCLIKEIQECLAI